MTAPRIVARGATYAITRRCAFRKLLLTPLSPVIHEGILYALALAQHKTGVLLHGDVLMPNHVHLTVTPTEENLPEFLRYLFGETGKFLKVALAEHGFEPPEHIWSPGRAHVMRLVDEGAQLSWLHYVATNPVDAGLVEHADHYPGHLSSPELLHSGRIVAKRPPFYFDRCRSAAELPLEYDLPPVLDTVFGRNAEPVVRHLGRAIRATERACNKRNAPVLGAAGVVQQHPWSEPRSPRQINTGPVPAFMVTGSKELRIQCACDTTRFRQRYAECLERRRGGDNPEFPYGTYALRVQHGARVQDPSTLHPLAVNAPGELREGPPLSRNELKQLGADLRKAASVPPSPGIFSPSASSRGRRTRWTERLRVARCRWARRRAARARPLATSPASSCSVVRPTPPADVAPTRRGALTETVSRPTAATPTRLRSKPADSTSSCTARFGSGRAAVRSASTQIPK